MKDYFYISHNFGFENVSRIEKFLTENNLIGVADLIKDGILAGKCSIRLPITDYRIELFKSEIKKHHGVVFVRFDREYSDLELDNSDFLVLLFKTVGLNNPNSNQSYNYTNACYTCGAGILPIPPIRIPQNTMGKKKIDITAHNNWLILTNYLKNKFQDQKVTGIDFHKAILGRDAVSFSWGHINNILPQLDNSSKMNFNHSKCSYCHKSGNLHSFSSETTYVYPKKSQQYFLDFNLTHEFFGEWVFSKLGGGRHIIISQKTRQILMDENAKYLDYIPVEIT